MRRLLKRLDPRRWRRARRVFRERTRVQWGRKLALARRLQDEAWADYYRATDRRVRLRLLKEAADWDMLVTRMEWVRL